MKPNNKNKKPEYKVKSLCLKRLEQWQSWGYVIDFDDLSALGKSCHRGRWVMHTKKGKRDIMAIIQQMDKAWVYLIEVKEPGGGTWSKEQQDYAKKFCYLNNVVYQVVSNPQQIDETLEEITGRSAKLLAEMKI